ncbi:MAG: class I SAM-dependent methyltransferase [Treponema sp.]|jgi:23S rRNA G2069 N7-methylase RlmK/C1962 C5-methylase RlmI|nr:class I SAM-dependent methyltransferase [Treponema sp.]
MNKKTETQMQMFANRLEKRFRHLKKWAQRTNVGAFRLYDRDIPEIPIVLDYYGEASRPQDAAIAGALYKRPYEKDEADEEKWLNMMKESSSLALGISVQRIFLKQRQRQRGEAQYEKMENARFEKIISEGNLSFKVNLSDYLDTGLFPDRRLLRAMVGAEASGKKILNLFSYTGSFSVYAAAGGAASTDSVDLSNTYLAWARENFSLNSLSAQIFSRQEDFFKSRSGQPHESVINRLIRADALDFIEKAASFKKRWDIIVLDPPSFSNSKKMSGSFDLRRDEKPLVLSCLDLLAPGGTLFLSINTQKHKTEISNVVINLSSCSNNIRVTDLSNKVVDEDFKGKKIPMAFLITG